MNAHSTCGVADFPDFVALCTVWHSATLLIVKKAFHLPHTLFGIAKPPLHTNDEQTDFRICVDGTNN